MNLLTLLLPTVNHLLAQEFWAMQQLQAHAGKIACIDFSVAMLRMQITAQGLLEAAPDDVQANVTIRIDLANVPLILQDQQRAISYVRIEGDADLAQAIAELAKNLPVDVGHELSKIFGDVAGQRMADTGKAIAANAKNTVQKFHENLAEYFLEENPMLVRPQSVAEFGAQVNRIRDDVERLMKRIEKL